MTGAEALIESLRVNGVRHIFGIPSTHTLEIYRALGQVQEIEHVTTTHEQGAAFMADGYARVTGRPGVCLVTAGAGSDQRRDRDRRGLLRLGPRAVYRCPHRHR